MKTNIQSAKRTNENSPAIYRWERVISKETSPRSGRQNVCVMTVSVFCRPFRGLRSKTIRAPYPAVNCWAFVAYILALACIRFKADQVVTGTGINILFIGLPAVLSGALFLSSGSTPQIPRENLLPTLSGLLPGFVPHWRILSEVSAISLLALVLALLTRYVLYRTPFGLRLRAVGENPEAADAAGVRVNRIRYAGVVLSGVLA